MSAAIVSGGLAEPLTQGRLTLLSCDDGPPPPLRARLEELAELPFVDHVLALPDLHQKSNAEVPSSLTITTRGTIVPEYTSVAINDGMGVVVTDLEEAGLAPERIAAFFRAVNASSAPHPLGTNRYSLSAGDLARALVDGAAGVAERYGFERDVPPAMESGGRVRVPGPIRSLDEVVPRALLTSRAARSEMGLNFGGNHFLEIQVVDSVEDSATASRWGLAPGRVVITYHLGPGPFGGTLLHFWTRRAALAGARVPLFFLAKLWFHGARRGRAASLGRAWRLHFRANGATTYAPLDPEGVRIRQALAMATNFGFAYRVATLAAIRDGLHETLSSAPGVRLLCDIPHNSLAAERGEDGPLWVARHNACRLEPGRPALVAGAHDVPSWLAVGLEGGDRRVHSYDHGAGQVIARWRSAGRLSPQRESTLRLWLGRGPHAPVRSLELLPVRASEPVERVIECFERCGSLARVARLRPLGTLKNQGMP